MLVEFSVSTLPTGEVGQKYYALKKSSPFVNIAVENGLHPSKMDFKNEKSEVRFRRSEVRFQRCEIHFRRIEVHFRQNEVRFQRSQVHFQQINCSISNSWSFNV